MRARAHKERGGRLRHTTKDEGLLGGRRRGRRESTTSTQRTSRRAHEKKKKKKPGNRGMSERGARLVSKTTALILAVTRDPGLAIAERRRAEAEKCAVCVL